MAGVIAPLARQRANLLAGYPVAPGAQLSTFLSGTSTNTPTYTDATLGTPNPNPIIADSAGLFPAIFLSPLLTYRFTCTDSLGGALWGPTDGISVADGTTVAANVTTAITAAVAAAAASTTGPVTVGNQAAFPLPVGTGDLVIRHANPTLLTVQGYAPGLLGQRLTAISVAAGQVDYTYNDAAAPVGNKIITMATSARTSLAPSVGTAEFIYDSSRWVMLTHDQGAWITPTFAAGNYVGSAGMTWTVAAGNVTTQKYKLRGRDLAIAFSLNNTTVGAPLSTDLQILQAAYGGYTINGQFNGAVAHALDNGTVVAAYIQNLGTSLRCLKTSLANWTAAAGTTTIEAEILVEVT